MKAALVLGASGHVGNAIARELIARNYEVTAVSRQRKPAPNLKGLSLKYEIGDLDSPGNLERWIAGHEVVVDAAAPYPISNGRDGDGSPSNAMRRTQAVLHAVQQRRSRLIFVSSFTTIVRNPSAAPTFGEARLARATHPYFAGKEAMESCVVAAAKAGLAAVIVNPTMCLGPWECRPRELCVVPQVVCGQIPIGSRHVLNIIDVRDAAEAAVNALEKERFGEPMLLSGRNVTMEELFSWICEIAKTKRSVVYAPTLGAGVLSWLSEMFLGVVDVPWMANVSLAAALISAHDWLPPSTALRDLSVKLRPLSATLRDSVAWHQQLGNC